jgi:hypothetical protein
MRKLVRKPIINIVAGVLLGLVLGLTAGFTISGIQQGKCLEIGLLSVGAVLGVILEEGFTFLLEYRRNIIQLRPLNQALGTIAEEDSYIYISPFTRNIKDSPLYRDDPDRDYPPRIIGSSLVYGRGDSIALALVKGITDKATFGKYQANVLDAGQALDIWGKSVICIGGGNNRKTREILEKFSELPFRFEENYTIITKPDSEIIYNSLGTKFIRGVEIKRSHDSSAIDYGFILKLKDQFHHPNDKTIIVIAGLGDTGTAGAAYYLSNHFSDLPYGKDIFGELIQVPSGYQSARKVDFDTEAGNYMIKLRQ